MYRIWYRRNGFAESIECLNLTHAQQAWDYANRKYEMISKRPT
jgi:hypothetical protein